VVAIGNQESVSGTIFDLAQNKRQRAFYTRLILIARSPQGQRGHRRVRNVVAVGFEMLSLANVRRFTAVLSPTAVAPLDRGDPLRALRNGRFDRLIIAS
jgi:hypothetical protein